ncbi:hypothetical protein [Leifsonia sp. 71-9]|uniref:hypothetical protein n=1 Tax=Leifsonia sp. 71-9 TaxID=1895934 RepID=UPI0025C0D14E|nr:hypothetical protein [Leifsonia sp. 71-9]
MRTGTRAAVIAGAVALALSAGTAGALAATTGRGGADDPPSVIEDHVGVPAATPSPPAPRPTPAAVPAPGPATHDIGDDQGADNPATHDVGDDHGDHGTEPGHGGHGGDD